MESEESEESETLSSEPSDVSDLSDLSDLSDVVDLSAEFEAIHVRMTEQIALHDHLLQRMSRLTNGWTTELHDAIDRCHRESLQDVVEGGRVTFGGRILRYLEG